MAILDTQKVDYLWKKLGYGVTKTDTDAAKKAYEESIPSPLLIRGDTIWQQSGSIPNSIPSTTSGAVTVYKDGTGSWSHTIKCTEDFTATDNKTWKTDLSNWISPEFGASYQVQVYIANDNATSPQSSGTKIFAAGSGNNDEWFFDYQSGVLNFIGINLPAAITTGVSGKSIFISGARYTGTVGVGTLDSANIGNLSIANGTLSSSTANANITLQPNGSGTIDLAGNTVVTGNLTATDIFGNIHLTCGNTSVVFITDNVITSSNSFTFDSSTNGLTVAGNIAAGPSLTIGSATIAANTISGNAGIFNLGISDLKIGLGTSNITIGASASTVTARGNLSATALLSSTLVSTRANTSVGTANTEIDSFSINTYRTAKYIITAGSNLGYQSMEVLLIHDGSDSYITVYGVISSSDLNIATITSSIVGGNVKLYATGTSSSTAVNVLSTYIKD